MKLKGAREQLASDLGGKYQAIDIDSNALGINEQSSGLRKRFSSWETYSRHTINPTFFS